MAIFELGQALGFAAERPDAEWGEGPDNLWCLRETDYLLIECKSEVDVARDAISKSEAGQMNTSCAWFEEHYGHSGFAAVLIFPGRKTAKGAGFAHDVKIMRQKELNRLVTNARRFFGEFASVDLGDLEPKIIQKWLVEPGAASLRSATTKNSVPNPRRNQCDDGRLRRRDGNLCQKLNMFEVSSTDWIPNTFLRNTPCPWEAVDRPRSVAAESLTLPTAHGSI